MTTFEIRQLEAGALAFGQKTYGDGLADAMYLGTFSSIHYFGPVFYDSNKSKQVQSFFIVCGDGDFSFLPAERFELGSDTERREYERRQHIWWDMIGSIQCAYERGRRDSVRQLESSGCPVEDIAHYAGMTIDEVNKLLQ